MKETGSQASARRHERLFLLCAAAVAVVCILLAAALAPPRLTPNATSETPMVQLIRVDLNTADLETLCVLPNVGEKRAQALLEYRGTHGPFRHVADAAKVPGLSESIVASWDGLAYVS